MISSLSNLGFILYPGGPNTTSVKQEMEKIYGIFKSHFRNNLELITQYQLKANKKYQLIRP